MNLLKGSKCYTIGPLECACFKYAKDWRNKLKEELEPLGIKILSPLDKIFNNYPQESENKNQELKDALKNGRYDYVHQEMVEIRARDLGACDVSTFLIAVLPEGIKTTGSIDEIITSLRSKKQVLLVIPETGYAGISLWLASYFTPEWVFKSIDEAIKVVKEIDNGTREVDNKYWKIIA